MDLYARASFYVCVLAVGLSGAIGDAFLNEWAKRGGTKWLLAGYAGWVITATILAFLLKKETFASAIVMFLLSNVMFALLISQFYFEERLSINQWIGIAIAILAMILMESKK